MRGLALALAATALLGAGDDVLIRHSDERKARDEPKRQPRRPEPPPPPPHGRVYRGGSVPGGARRAIERELRAQDD